MARWLACGAALLLAPALAASPPVTDQALADRVAALPGWDGQLGFELFAGCATPAIE